VADALGLAGVRGIGHSCGGAALLLAEQSRPGTFASLFLYEPIVFSPDQVSAMGDNRLSNLARRRRNHFESRAAARANYASKPPFERFDPSSLDAYVRYGLVDRADGTVSLACSPDEEASMYEGATRHKAYDHLAEVGVPVRLAGGAAGGDISPEMLETLASRLPDGDVAMEDGLTHFGPMEAPLELGRTIADWLDSVGARSTNVVPPPR
ncbi:MAG: alpha/beta fold hydrolase, partial [Acidimicrobiales bacterium]